MVHARGWAKTISGALEDTAMRGARNCERPEGGALLLTPNQTSSSARNVQLRCRTARLALDERSEGSSVGTRRTREGVCRLFRRPFASVLAASQSQAGRRRGATVVEMPTLSRDIAAARTTSRAAMSVGSRNGTVGRCAFLSSSFLSRQHGSRLRADHRRRQRRGGLPPYRSDSIAESLPADRTFAVVVATD